MYTNAHDDILNGSTSMKMSIHHFRYSCCKDTFGDVVEILGSNEHKTNIVDTETLSMALVPLFFKHCEIRFFSISCEKKRGQCRLKVAFQINIHSVA